MKVTILEVLQKEISLSKDRNILFETNILQFRLGIFCQNKSFPNEQFLALRFYNCNSFDFSCIKIFWMFSLLSKENEHWNANFL